MSFERNLKLRINLSGSLWKKVMNISFNYEQKMEKKKFQNDNQFVATFA